MALSNAEKQKRWRDKRNALAKLAEAGKAAPAAAARIAKLEKRCKELEAKVEAAMPRATMTAVIKCLHPDQRKNATEKNKDDALRLFTEWMNNAKKAGRG